VKTAHLVSILVLGAATTFACNDDGDRTEGGSSGKASVAGSAGKNGAAGSSAGSTTEAGAGGGAAGSTSDGGMGGVAGTNEGGEAGGGASGGGEAGGGAGATTSEAGSAGMAGAGGDGGAGGAPDVPDVVVPGPSALIGSWHTNFDGTEVITANTWSGANIVAYTSGVTVVYTHNPPSDPYNPRKFSRYVYTEPVGDSFYFCQIVYDADTLEAAQTDPKVADATKLETNGCSGFSWTKATKL
jgi:hypothetical protein